MNICIVYEINLCDREYDDYSTLENSFFVAFKLVKSAHTDKCDNPILIWYWI